MKENKNNRPGGSSAGLFGSALLLCLLFSMAAVMVAGSLIGTEGGRRPISNLMLALKNGFEESETEELWPEGSEELTESESDPGTLPPESKPDDTLRPDETRESLQTEPTGTVPATTDGPTAPPDSDPPETAAPVTVSPDTAPQTTKPQTTKPSVTNPPVTTPPVTSPPVTDSPITDEDRVNDPNYFDDALFIGDSRTVGLANYGRITGATYYAKTSKNVKNLFAAGVASETEKSGLDLTEFLKKYTFGKIYIMLGINEIGYSYDWIVKYYKADIEKIRELQPGAVIIIQSNMHVTKAKSDANPKTFNNNRINELNRRLAQLADNETVFYVDICPAFDDSTGAMNPAYTGDGVHLKGKYYALWRDYLLTYGKR